MAAPDIHPAPGVLLIAPPMMDDPNFRRTVVLLCEHNPEGSFGLILNRPLSIHLEDVLDDVYGYSDLLSLGGPVQTDTLHFLHQHGDRIPEAVRIMGGVDWGGDFETVKALIASEQLTARDLRFFLGYAGWSAGQIDAEIDQGGWILAPADPALVFHEAPDQLWRLALRQMGGEYAVLANFPDDPRMN